MLWIFYLLVFLFLSITFYQDYKYRAVSWFVFPLLFAAFITISIYETSWRDVVYNSAINFSFIIIIFGMITLYFSLKSGKLVNVTRKLIGWGDILFLICLAVFFGPLNFMVFYTISLFVVMCFTLLYKWLSGKKEILIPLAGLQSLLLIILLVSNLAFRFLDLFSDAWMYYMLYA